MSLHSTSNLDALLSSSDILFRTSRAGQGNYQNPGWAKLDGRSGPCRARRSSATHQRENLREAALLSESRATTLSSRLVATKVNRQSYWAGTLSGNPCRTFVTVSESGWSAEG